MSTASASRGRRRLSSGLQALYLHREPCCGRNFGREWPLHRRRSAGRSFGEAALVGYFGPNPSSLGPNGQRRGVVLARCGRAPPAGAQAGFRSEDLPLRQARNAGGEVPSVQGPAERSPNGRKAEGGSNGRLGSDNPGHPYPSRTTRRDQRLIATVTGGGAPTMKLYTSRWVTEQTHHAKWNAIVDDECSYGHWCRFVGYTDLSLENLVRR